MISGMGDDVLYRDEGGAAIHGGSFDLDEIFGGRRMVPDGVDTIFGGGGGDCVWGGSLDDVLHGGEGSDFVGTYCLDFVMGTGSDTMYAGSGNELLRQGRRGPRAVSEPPRAGRRLLRGWQGHSLLREGRGPALRL